LGLLLKLVTLPVSGPVEGTIWMAEQLQAVADREFYDEGTIRQELMELEHRFEAGELAEEEFDDSADALLERLMIAEQLEHVQHDRGEPPVDEESGDA
jgi:Gas vesicle protein G